MFFLNLCMYRQLIWNMVVQSIILVLENVLNLMGLK